MSKRQTIGIASGMAVFHAIRADKVQEVIANFPPCLKHGEIFTITGTNNRNIAAVNVTYGPVRGAWPSDIRRKLARAARKAGTTAEPRLEHPGRVRVG